LDTKSIFTWGRFEPFFKVFELPNALRVMADMIQIMFYQKNHARILGHGLKPKLMKAKRKGSEANKKEEAGEKKRI